LDTTIAITKQLHKMQEGLPRNIKSECCYYVKHLADHFTFHWVLSYCSEDNQQQFRGEEGSKNRHLITRYIKNVKRSPQAYKEELRGVSPTEAPVIAAVHQLLQKCFPNRFTTIMSSDSSPPIDSPSSSSSFSDGATRARACSRLKTARRSSSDKKSSNAAALSVGFAQLSVAHHCNKHSPCNGKPAAAVINKALV
jgi:hypothetical protein